MPELPEVETIRRGVEAEFAGRRVKSVEATGARSTRRHPDVRDFVARLEGRRLESVDRRGKYLLCRLDSGDVMAVHLGMSGQLLRAGAHDPLSPHTHVVWWFAGGPQLRFVDPRTFGEVWVTRPGDAGRIAELAHLGVDALTGLPTWRSLGRVLAGRQTRIKALLMDQRVIAGIGNLYADEILFASRLHGGRAAGDLSGPEVRRLHAAVGMILRDAIAARGSSLLDEQYRDLYGFVGAYQADHAVYGREGKPCPRCGRPVLRVKAGGRSSFSCPRCQVSAP